MEKSIYSLTLFDEIVEKIDDLANNLESNRSQLINDILAEYLGLMTPEQKIQKIIENLYINFKDRFTINQITKNSSIQFGKSLKFKYRPKVKFSYEFIGDGAKKYAVLKISSRSTSEELNKMFEKFFGQIKELELRNNIFKEENYKQSLSHKFIREFRDKGSITKDITEVAKFLTNYLKMIDQAMNLFFIKQDSDLSDKFQFIFDYYLMPKDLEIKKDNPIVLI